jgi:hypothetical protein
VDATRASIPLHLAANGSVEVGQDTSIVLGGDATELLLGDNADRVEGVGVPPARELLANCEITRFRSSSEGAAQSPVGRPTTIYGRSTEAG